MEHIISVKVDIGLNRDECKIHLAELIEVGTLNYRPRCQEKLNHIKNRFPNIKNGVITVLNT